MFILSHTTTPAPFPLLILCYSTNSPTRHVRYYGAHVLSPQPFVSSPSQTVADTQGQQGECACAAHCYSATFTANVSVFAELFQDTDVSHSCQSSLLNFFRWNFKEFYDSRRFVSVYKLHGQTCENVCPNWRRPFWTFENLNCSLFFFF
jgi:hypothetical protein